MHMTSEREKTLAIMYADVASVSPQIYFAGHCSTFPLEPPLNAFSTRVLSRLENAFSGGSSGRGSVQKMTNSAREVDAVWGHVRYTRAADVLPPAATGHFWAKINMPPVDADIMHGRRTCSCPRLLLVTLVHVSSLSVGCDQRSEVCELQATRNVLIDSEAISGRSHRNESAARCGGHHSAMPSHPTTHAGARS
jgi:hypothetical protein